MTAFPEEEKKNVGEEVYKEIRIIIYVDVTLVSYWQVETYFKPRFFRTDEKI